MKSFTSASRFKTVFSNKRFAIFLFWFLIIVATLWLFVELKPENFSKHVSYPTPNPLNFLSATDLKLTKFSLKNYPYSPIDLKLRLDKIQIGVVQNIYVRNQHIFLMGSYGLAILDLDQKETFIKRLKNFPLGIDGNGHVWYLSEQSDSIFRWDGQNSFEYRKEQGWILPAKLYDPPLPALRTSLLSIGETIWLATSTDVRYFNGNEWHIFTATEIGIKLPYKTGVQPVFTVSRNPVNGEIWVAACYWQGADWIGGSLPYRFNGNTWYKSDFPDGNACVTSITFTAHGSGFLTTPSDIWRYDGQEWKKLSIPLVQKTPRTNSYQIKQMWMDNFDKPWFLLNLVNQNGVSTQQYLLQYHSEGFTKISSFEGISAPQIFFTPDGSLTSFRNGQIFLHTPSGWVTITDRKFDIITQDNFGNLWLISDVKSRPVLWKITFYLSDIRGVNQ
ncbi:MAG: hypothetical protein KatS3mg047_0865 [Bellilinea sp.]|nr:MAG: hypothetical protein KatS3mg047_0865 [Bellilinea sp.]